MLDCCDDPFTLLHCNAIDESKFKVEFVDEVLRIKYIYRIYKLVNNHIIINNFLYVI